MDEVTDDNKIIHGYNSAISLVTSHYVLTIIYGKK